MAPPSYRDLGKACNDVFDKGYNLTLFRLSTNQSTCGDVGMKGEVIRKFEDSTLNATLESNTKLPWFGLSLQNRWFTNNFLSHGMSCQDSILPGLKLGAEATWNPQTGEKSAKTTGQYKHEMATVDLEVNTDGDFSNVVTNISAVGGYNGWLAGVQGVVGPSGGLDSNSITLGNSVGDTQTFLTCENLNTFKASVFQRVSDRCEYGIQFGYSTNGETPENLAVAGRYLVSACSSIRGKINNEGIFTCGYESLVQDGVTLSIATEMDVKNITGGQKFGIGLNLEK